MRLYFKVPPEENGLKLGPFLRRQGVSVSLVRSLKYEETGLMVGGWHARTNQILYTGDEVCIHLPADEVPRALAEDIPLKIIHESAHVMVVDKPAGLVMHPTLSHKSGTMANAFAHLMAQRGHTAAFRPVGRLDANTSGLVLCAMNAFAAALLPASMKKEYLALVGGNLEEDGFVDVPLGPAQDSAILQRVDAGGRPCRTDFQVLAHAPGWSFLSLRLQTGRTHQIRVHMAHRGHPLLGDGLYGGDCARLERHALHCAGISYVEPQGEKMVFVAGLPLDLRAVIQEAAMDWTDAGIKWLACQNFDTIV